jgi:acyl carrier protein
VDRLKNLAVLREVVAEVLAIDPGLIVEEANLRKDLRADSLDLAEIVMNLQDRLGVSLPEQGLNEITTVGQALDWISLDHHEAAS